MEIRKKDLSDLMTYYLVSGGTSFAFAFATTLAMITIITTARMVTSIAYVKSPSPGLDLR